MNGRMVGCPNILKLITRPNHGDMLCTWLYYEACCSLNKQICQSLVLFLLKMAFWHLFLFFFVESPLNQSNLHLIYHI